MRIWHFIYGYVIIRTEGLSLEKFLNLAAGLGIRVHDVKRVSYTVLNAGVSARGYSKLKKAVPEKYRMTTLSKKGVPFGARWLVMRWVLLAGLIAVALVIGIASQFVWDVKVSGLEYREAKKIIAELETLGVKAGAYKGDLDLKAATTKMIIAHDEIAWMDISFKGVVVAVKILPADMPPDVYDENRPCDIIAKKDACIESIIALAGRAVVSKGDTVRAGDKLISGLVWDEGMPRMLFAAKGRVVGNVWYKGQQSAPVFKETREKTGRAEIKRVIYMGGDSAQIDGPSSFDEYDVSVKDEYYIGGGLFLPVKVEVLEYSEVTITQAPAPFDVLIVYLEERAYYEAQSKAPDDAKIIGHKTFFETEDGIMTATVYLNTHEEIGRTVYLEE